MRKAPVLLEPPIREWYCPNCTTTDTTRELRPHTRFHTCPKLRFLTAPLLEVTVKAKVALTEREDYVNNEAVFLDPEKQRPVMNIVTIRDEGTDAMVFAPTATLRGAV